jgi:lipopolysaccharide transport system ATP-binding protein
MEQEIAIRFTDVSKRFRRGEMHDSLRDLLPALTRRMLGRRRTGAADQRDFWALTDINLEVRHGETLGVIGHNGAGKSTMLKHLAGIMTPTHGHIEVRGRLSALIEIGAGFHPDLTGRENVFLSGVILGMSRAEVASKFDVIVEFSGLASFIDMAVKRYSSGMFARLGFSVAAHLEPDILVIDEVLSVGDYVFQQKSLQKMREIAKSGATVIFVSHNLKAVSDLCQRTVLLDRGSIVADGPTEDIIQTYLSRERSKLKRVHDADVEISEVALCRDGQPAVRFHAGEKASVHVTFTARRATQHIAVVIAVLDKGLANIFDTSSERLGSPPISLLPGQSCTVNFDLQMHLAIGTFHLGVYLYRYDLQREYDRALPAATFFVDGDRDVRGAANLYPAVRSIQFDDRGHVVCSREGTDGGERKDLAADPSPAEKRAGVRVDGLDANASPPVPRQGEFWNQ